MSAKQYEDLMSTNDFKLYLAEDSDEEEFDYV
jgi:hypothetical protein